jgi:hypothetical protein
MKNYRSLLKTVISSASIIGSSYVIGSYISDESRQQPLKASWTNSYEPSVKWDHNWDRFNLFLKMSILIITE